LQATLEEEASKAAKLKATSQQPASEESTQAGFFFLAFWGLAGWLLAGWG
jgi:hypothetical protein